MVGNLATGLCRHSVIRPTAPALMVAGREFTYGALADLARRVAAWLLDACGSRNARVGVLAGRSVGTYAGVVGACWAGATYIPLGLKWPTDRLLAAMRQTRLDALIIDREASQQLSPQLVAACPKAVLMAEPDAAGLDGFQTLSSLASAPAPLPRQRPDSHIAYTIFTSGTTGIPKGVEVSLGAVAGHLATIQDVYRFTPEDRISLAFELTFDPSILNMLMTWNAGASLHVVPEAEAYAPVGFIQDHALTVWNSTPATIGLLQTLGALQPGVLPHLRVSIFGGDTLTLAGAQAWQRAAPNSTVDNVYGPTEATIECLHQRLTDPPVVTRGRESLALGVPYSGTTVAIMDEHRRLLTADEIGEIAVAGPQLATGYLGDPALTAARFPMIDGVRWYLTGDAGYRDREGRFHHLGRLDDQVKVRGFRVELGEIDNHLRQICGTELAAAVAWPFVDGSPVGIVGFIVPSQPDLALSSRAIIEALKARLPVYMVPQQIREIAHLPTTPHGKTDRAALLKLLGGA